LLSFKKTKSVCSYRRMLERWDFPITRRFFINTLLTFILLGIVVGTAFAADASLFRIGASAAFSSVNSMQGMLKWELDKAMKLQSYPFCAFYVDCQIAPSKVSIGRGASRIARPPTVSIEQLVQLLV